MISSAVLVQMKGLGSVFQALIQARMSFSRARRLLCTPRRSFLSASSRTIARPG